MQIEYPQVSGTILLEMPSGIILYPPPPTSPEPPMCEYIFLDRENNIVRIEELCGAQAAKQRAREIEQEPWSLTVYAKVGGQD